MSRLAVIDGSLLSDIEQNDPFASDVFGLLEASGFSITMTSTGGQELLWAAHKIPDLQAAAVGALEAWQRCGVYFADLEPTHHCWVGEAVEEMLREGIIQPNQKNIALIICEAAQIDAKYVIFEDSVLPKLNIDAIKACMDKRDLNRCPHIISRKRCYKLASDGKL